MSHLAHQYGPLLEAVAFAARAHDGQMRKDGATPYVSHVFRVCLIVRDLFGVADPRVLTAALLHDTIEDTLKDFDDVEEQFGAEIASWVAALTKEKRLPWAEREGRYSRELAAAPWQVQVCKLADVCDNLLDLPMLPAEKRLDGLHKKRLYLDALKEKLAPEAAEGWRVVDQLYRELEVELSGLRDK